LIPYFEIKLVNEVITFVLIFHINGPTRGWSP
jgi:hypothetical protein